MSKKKLLYAFKIFWAKQQLVIATMLVLSTSAFAQLTNPNENNQIPWSNIHFVYEEQPAVSVYAIAEERSAVPSTILTDNISNLPDNNPGTTLWNNPMENHSHATQVNPPGKNLTAIVYDSNGNRVMPETSVDPISYGMEEQTRDLKPGIYFLTVMERGIIIEKQKFVVK